MTTYYHGSYEIITDIKNNQGLFDGLFFSADENDAAAHGKNLDTIELEENEILTNSELNYDISYDVIKELVSIDMIDEVLEDSCNDLTDAERGWEIQRLRGVIARHLGYKAVRCTDEHGSVLLVVSGEVNHI